MMKKYLILLLAIVTSCTSAAKHVSPKPAKENSKNEVSYKCLKSIQHKAAPNSKTGVRDGYILIGSYVVPDIFTRIQASDKAYCFLFNTKKSREQGYHSCKIIKINDSSQQISIDELEKGWYMGSSQKKGTPVCWLFVSWNGGTAFVNPDKAEEVITNEFIHDIFPLKRSNTRLIN